MNNSLLNRCIVLERKVAKAIRNRGPLGAAGHAFGSAFHALWDLRPSARRRRREYAERQRAFDEGLGVDTGGRIPLEALSVASEDRFHGNQYQATESRAFHALIGMVGEAAGRTFIDIGSGKGRVLLLAGEYPFRRIIGVEFAAELVEVSRRNVREYRNPAMTCRDIEVVHASAPDYELPGGPLVLFLYNPFDATVMSRFVANVERSLRADPRPITVLYLTPEHDELWRRSPAFEPVSSSDGYSIHRSRATA